MLDTALDARAIVPSEMRDVPEVREGQRVDDDLIEGGGAAEHRQVASLLQRGWMHNNLLRCQVNLLNVLGKLRVLHAPVPYPRPRVGGNGATAAKLQEGANAEEPDSNDVRAVLGQYAQQRRGAQRRAPRSRHRKRVVVARRFTNDGPRFASLFRGARYARSDEGRRPSRLRPTNDAVPGACSQGNVEAAATEPRLPPHPNAATNAATECTLRAGRRLRPRRRHHRPR